MTPTELAVMIGTTVGSALGTYALAAKRLLKRPPSEPPEPPPRTSTLPSDPTMGPAMALTAQEVRKIASEAAENQVKLALRDYLSVEEFNAYCDMDSTRREKLIEGFGELRGKLAVLLKDR